MLNNQSIKPLETLVNTRKGGVYNIRGIVYQAVYTVYRLVYEFSSDVNDNSVFQLEGVEDLDFYRLHNSSSGEFIQLKCLDENLKASQFTHNILPNLLEVYDKTPDVRFTIVSNVHLDKTLSELKSLKYGKPLSEKGLLFWQEKIKTLGYYFEEPAIKHFLDTIHFERKTQDELLSEIQKLLILKFEVINDNDIRFTQALFYAVLEWSKQKAFVRKKDVYAIIQAVYDDMSKGAINNAIQGGWFTKVSFDTIIDDISANGYFEGKAAKPIHIVANLPIKRPKWEKEIIDSFLNFDVTVIKASSGQGKSTLAWQVAQALLQQNYIVYELNEIGVNGVNDAFTFIESRLRVGILPLIVIDSLNDTVKDWAILAEKSQILRGVKFLITTREEDWFHYGKQRVSRLNLKAVNIELSENEAQNIFTAFKKQGKLHVNVSNWQVAWEKVRDKKLLIEYVYLLTQGNMIHERMEEQIQGLELEIDSSSKISILRLVSIADMLNIKITTKKLLRFVEQHIGFKNDKGTVLNSLKSEYHIQLEENYWVIGLHSVRSTHIAHILHQALPYSETLIQLISIIDASKMFTLISQIPQLPMSVNDRQSFFEDLANTVSIHPYSTIVETVNGVYALDAHQHWLENKDVYDKISNQGLMVYVIKKSPFSQLQSNSFDFLIEHAPHMGENFAAIKDFNIHQSNTLYFLRQLNVVLQTKPVKENLSKAGYLQRWFQRYDLKASILRGVSVTDLEQALIEKPVIELSEILHSVYNINKNVYDSFYRVNKDKLLSKLQIETNTITAFLKDNTIVLRYIVNNDQDIKKQSVNRAEVFAYCLPHIENLDIAGLDFPTPLILNYLKHDDSTLKTSQTGWLTFDNFVTKANQAWLNTIEQVYEFETQYEWENYWVEYRRKLLNWVQQTCRIIENVNDSKKLKTIIPLCDKSKAELYNHKRKEKSLRYDDEYFPKSVIVGETSKIRDWNSAAENVLIQTFPDFKEADKWHLYKLNTRSAATKVDKMQTAFDTICQKTAHFFDVNDLKNQEETTFTYLADLIEYVYDEVYIKKIPIINIRQDVKKWKTQKHQKLIAQLHEVKETFETATIFELVLPQNILYEGDFLTSIVLGIRDITPQDFDLFADSILHSLFGLAEIQVTYFYLVLIDNQNTALSNGIKFSHDTLLGIIDVFHGRKTSVNDSVLPTPLSEVHINQLKAIKQIQNPPSDVIKNSIIAIHNSLWQFTEIRNRLTNTEKGCQIWKQKSLTNLQEALTLQLTFLKSESVIYRKYGTLMQQVYDNKLDFNKEACFQYWQEDIG